MSALTVPFTEAHIKNPAVVSYQKSSCGCQQASVSVNEFVKSRQQQANEKRDEDLQINTVSFLINLAALGLNKSSKNI